jgi:hypothetical protein
MSGPIPLRRGFSLPTVQGGERRLFFSQVYHTGNDKVPLATAAEIQTMDAIYLLMLAGLYLVTHGLVSALNRLGNTS